MRQKESPTKKSTKLKPDISFITDVPKRAIPLAATESCLMSRSDTDTVFLLADDDINENWEIYRERFLRGEFP
jgi:hypothetical protein